MRLKIVLTFLAHIAAILVLDCKDANAATDSWNPKAGCHLVGYKKEVKVPGCHVAHIRMNACRGYCLTYSFLSDSATLERSDGTQLFTSHGSCCAISATHDVHFTLQCENNQVYRNTFKSARDCSCTLCSKP